MIIGNIARLFPYDRELPNEKDPPPFGSDVHPQTIIRMMCFGWRELNASFLDGWDIGVAERNIR